MKKLNKFVCLGMVASVLLHPVSTYAFVKTETIYSNLSETGTPVKTVVNNHLSRLDSGSIDDESQLKEILNINGKEKFSFHEQKLTWQSTGRDIFYQGSLDRELPIKVSATYFLNGEEMEASSIVGKKGHVSIQLDFVNHAYQKEKKLYTPFVVTVGTMINNKENSNIVVTNGKSVDTGTRNMVVAIAAPGLYEDLSIDEFKGLDQITISYDTTKFSLGDVYFVATPKLLEDADLDVFKKVSSLDTSMNRLQESLDQIQNGAITLTDGTVSLANGSNEIYTNLEKAYIGVSQLQQGSLKLDAGLKQVIATLQETQGMIQNKDITGSVANLEQLKQANMAAITTLSNTNSHLEQTYQAYGLSNFSSEEELSNYFSRQGISSDIIKNLITCKKTYEGNLSLATLLTTNNKAFEQTIVALTELSSQIDTLLTNLNQVLNNIEVGASTLDTGLKEVKLGLYQLYVGSKQLADGSVSLSDGAKTLKEGIEAFNQKGIGSLKNYTKTFVNYSDKVEKLVELTTEYRGFTANNVDKTLFVYKMKALK